MHQFGRIIHIEYCIIPVTISMIPVVTTVPQESSSKNSKISIQQF